MNSKLTPVTGTLLRKGKNSIIKGDDGSEHFRDCSIWQGYITHWEGKRLSGRILPELDYKTGKPIVLLWPASPPSDETFVELYYNERLVRYIISFLGHIAINVNGEIFNYSHLINECEVMSVPEYFYRPALGQFAPGPGGGFDISDPEHPYYDKFGRNFMRTIHVLRISGRDTASLSSSLHRELKLIHDTPVDPEMPDHYRDFNILTRNCTTIIRDALREWGFPRIKGVFPRDMFTSAEWNFYLESRNQKLDISIYRMPQLMVPEAPRSAMTPLVNPANYVRTFRMRQLSRKID